MVNKKFRVDKVNMCREELLEEFRTILLACGEETCFYCMKKLRKNHVDHFIPWSYVQNDVLWNFVLACPSCNSSKNNKLAHPRFLERLIERNEMVLHERMDSYYVEKLKDMYDFAVQNGFPSGWEPINSIQN